jgi:hypothetical protein
MRRALIVAAALLAASPAWAIDWFEPFFNECRKAKDSPADMMENPYFDNTRLTDHGDYVAVEWDHNGKRIQNLFYRDQIVCQQAVVNAKVKADAEARALDKYR